jgi:type VI secretion system protein ImpJ
MSCSRYRRAPAPVRAAADPVFTAGASYFELDRNSPHWQQMQASGDLPFRGGEFPNLRMELWAIRG